ncbi:MAG: hypothetical protein HOQ43_07610 [Glycomyces artemisiae]|uniref:Uncharacterized protein n=1 Tax=Glycomyces artemisiae TaxID=1076443 RepID=A0A850C231_9ACTN|nr:hypothetical protein [Glycomyces artemisiae]
MPLKTLFAAAGTLALMFTLALDAPAPAAEEHEHEHPGNVLTLSVITDPTPEQQEAAAEADLGVLNHGDKGHTYPPDLDGNVPTYYGGDCYDNVLAYATWWSEGDWYIVYDKCEMERWGAGQNDWDRVGAHEKAHTDGWGHGEEPRDRNAAFDAGIVICRC